MNRRGFLSALAAAVAGPMVLDPEFAVWRPGAKLISIPKPLTLAQRDVTAIPSLTISDLIHDAHRRLGVIDSGQSLCANDFNMALRTLNRMMDDWNTDRVSHPQFLEFTRELQPYYEIAPQRIL